MNTAILSRLRQFLVVAMMSLVIGLIPNTLAQDIECQCDDYLESYAQASAEYSTTLGLYLEATPELAIELESELTMKSEALAEAQANLEGCQERVQENAMFCSEKELSEDERSYLMENPGRVSFGEYMTVESLASALYEDLIIHQNEISVDAEAGYTSNAEMLMEYLGTEHNLDVVAEMGFESIMEAMELAIKSFLEGLGIGMFDEGQDGDQPAPCPDCTDIQNELNAKNAAKTALETELNNARQREQDAQNEYDQFMSDLADAINGVEDCRTVDNYADVQLGNQEAAGIIMGAHYHCEGETAIENFLDAINEFRNNQTKNESELMEAINDAQAEIVNLTIDLAGIEVDIAALEASLVICQDRRAELNCEDDETPTGDDSTQNDDNTGGETNSGSGRGRRRTIPSEPLEPTELGSDPTELNLVETTVEEVEEITEDNQTAIETFTDAIRAKYELRSELNFQDLAGLDPETEAAIRALGRLRILLGQGEVSSDTAPRMADPNSQINRAELAALFFRVGQVLEGYATSETGAQIFTDVDPSLWYGPAYEWMFVNGFYVQSRPSDTLNNAEFITVLRRLLLLDPIIPDGASVWYDQEFATMAELLPADYDAEPWENPTRGFVIRMIYRALVQGGFEFN